MNMKILVSIIMPAYNASNYIKATIDSVLAQTLSDWELIVINDCSKDNTAEIVREYGERDERISLIDLTSNMGAPAGPRNIGVKQAQGQWIAFLDSDDIWHPEKLARQLQLLEKTGAKFCSTQMIDFHDGEYPALEDASAEQYEWISFSKQLFKYRTPTSSVVVSRSLIAELPFNESPLYKAREDLDCWLRCHEVLGKSVKITAPMLGYRIIGGQISGNKWQMVKRHFHVLRNYRLQNGSNLPLVKALMFTFTHFSLAVIFRRSNRGL